MGDKWIRKCYVLQEFRFRFLEVHYESGKKDSIESTKKPLLSAGIREVFPFRLAAVLRQKRGTSNSPLLVFRLILSS